MLQRVDLDEKTGFAGREWEKALGWISLLSGRSEEPAQAPPQSDAPEATPEFFNSMFGFSKDASDDGDLHVPGTLTIAQSMTGCTYDIEPVPGAAEQQKYRIEIPPGVFNGTKMRLAGRGARRKDGAVGDLYLVIAVRDSGPFRLEERTLHLDLPLSPAEAAAGAERDIHLPGGRVLRASIPADVADGMIVRLSGCGLPARGVHPAGDVMLHVKVG
jgi:curved DNA-binding protein